MEVRYGITADFAWLQEHDNTVGSHWIRRCLDNNEYVLALDEAGRSGFLRFSLFWGTIPYMDLIRVSESRRRKGIGTALFDFWEREMRNRGAKVLLTSAMVSELSPQRWHRRNGFRECGQLTFGRHQSTPELFFIRDLAEG